MTRVLEVPPEFPRPLLTKAVNEFNQLIPQEGYSHILVNLPPWGASKVEVCVLKRDQAVLVIIIPKLTNFLSQAMQQSQQSQVVNAPIP